MIQHIKKEEYRYMVREFMCTIIARHVQIALNLIC
jgi:hypothetical protein